MRHTELQSIRAFREEERLLEAARREAEDRPVREAEEKLRTTYQQLASVERARLLGELPDPVRFVDPAVGPGVRIADSRVDAFNSEHISAFRDANPEVFWGRELVELLQNYFAKNGLLLVTTLMLSSVVIRLRDVALLPERPYEESESDVVLPIVVAEQVPLRHTGWDSKTGDERDYSEYEVNRMTSDQFRHAFRVRKSLLAG